MACRGKHNGSEYCPNERQTPRHLHRVPLGRQEPVLPNKPSSTYFPPWSCGTTTVVVAVVVLPAASVARYVIVYVRPGPLPARVAFTWNVRSSVPNAAS